MKSIDFDVQKKSPIVAFGDSLVVGVGSPETEGFVRLLAEKVGQLIINEGVRGDTTADGVMRIASVFQHNPQIVIVFLGMNDYLRKIPQEETKQNLHTLITQLQSKGIQVIFLGACGDGCVDEYGAMYDNLANATGAVYVPHVLAGVFGNEAYMFDDIHPNRGGYAMVAEKVYKKLATILF